MARVRARSRVRGESQSRPSRRPPSSQSRGVCQRRARSSRSAGRRHADSSAGRAGARLRYQRRCVVGGAGAARSLPGGRCEDLTPRGRRSHASAGLRALHGGQEQLERAHVAVADRPPWRRVSAGVARRRRRTSLLPGRRRICAEGQARQDVYRPGPRSECAERHRVPRRREARRTVHARRPRSQRGSRARELARLCRRGESAFYGG